MKRARCRDCLAVLARVDAGTLRIRCRRCRGVCVLEIDGSPEEIRCEANHPRRAALCDALVAKREGGGIVLIRCRDCGRDRRYPPRGSRLLDAPLGPLVGSAVGP